MFASPSVFPCATPSPQSLYRQSPPADGQSSQIPTPTNTALVTSQSYENYSVFPFLPITQQTPKKLIPTSHSSSEGSGTDTDGGKEIKAFGYPARPPPNAPTEVARPFYRRAQRNALRENSMKHLRFDVRLPSPFGGHRREGGPKARVTPDWKEDDDGYCSPIVTASPGRAMFAPIRLPPVTGF